MDNQVVVITGAFSGLGFQTALAFAKRGVKLAICGRSKVDIKPVLESLLEITTEEKVLVEFADVSEESQVKEFVNSIYNKFGRIDVLINNAAVFEQYIVADTPLHSWNYHFENNLNTVFLMMRECIPLMRSQKDGKIINITSSLTKEGAAGFGAYSASKAAVETLTFSVEDEEYKNGIKVYLFNPGVMKSGFSTQGEDPANIAPSLVEFVNLNLPVEKKPFLVEDIQKLCL